MVKTVTADFHEQRNRVRGILVALLILLVVFSLVWYLLAPTASIGLVVADNAETEAVSEVEPFYVLLIGSDTRKGTAVYTGVASEEGQTTESSDVLTLVRVDPQSKVLTFLTIPGDTLSFGQDAKISSWLGRGDALSSVREVEKITGVTVPYYFLINFVDFEDLVNALGGVVVDVPEALIMQDPATGTEVRLRAGAQQRLNGAQALALAMSWDNVEEREVYRQVSVRNIEIALINQVASADEETIRRVATLLFGSVKTNMDDALLVSLALDYATHRDAYTIYSGSGPYRGIALEDVLWVVPYSEEVWDALMETVDAGLDPNTVVRTPFAQS